MATITERAENAIQSIFEYDTYSLSFPAATEEEMLFAEERILIKGEQLDILVSPAACVAGIFLCSEDEGEELLPVEVVGGLLRFSVSPDTWYEIGVDYTRFPAGRNQKPSGGPAEDASIDLCLTKVLVKPPEQYMTPEESLEFVRKSSNRNTISRQLIKTLHALGVDGDETQLRRYLTEKLIETDPQLEKNRKSLSQTVKKWFTWNVSPSREMALKICFALGLDDNLTNDFLRKGCFLNGFNLRDAEEVICFFCLLNHLPYSDAQEMLARFEAAPSQDSPQNDVGTVVLMNRLQDAKWDSKEDFLEKFLIPNKDSFVGYSKTAVAIVEQETGKLCYNIIRGHLKMLFQTDVVSDDLSNSNESYWKKDPVLNQVLKYIDARAAEDPDFAEMSALLHSRRSANARDTVGQVDCFVMDKGREFKRDWKLILPVDRIYDEAVFGIPEYWYYSRKVSRGKEEFRPYAERRPFKNSDLYDDRGVLSSFPRAAELSMIRYVNGKPVIAPKTRNVILLLKFFNYCYDFMRLNSPDLTYEAFYESMTNILETCHLAYLYPGDPFDWLILKCVYLFELSLDEYDYEEDKNPIEYFNEVIRLSFREEADSESEPD